MPSAKAAYRLSAPLCRRRAIGLAGLFATLLLAGCDSPAPQAQQQAVPPPAVIVEAAEMRDLTEERTFTGRIEAIDKVQIRARVQGFLRQRLFEEGAEVRKGDRLFEIEREPYQIAVQQAEASLANAEAALTLAQQTHDRTKELVSQNAVAQATLDTTLSSLMQARATVQGQKATLDDARLNLSYTEIMAPMDGRVGRAAYSIGNLVGPDSNALVTLVAQDPMYVTFPVPQELLLEVRKQGRAADSVVVKLRLADGTTYDQIGEVRFIDVQATASTDSVIVRASIANPRRLLIDQQLVNVAVIRKAPDRKLMVSQSALLLDQQGPYVLAVGADDKVAIKRIATGEQRGAMIVVDKGLAEGERVIVSGHQKARPGSPVTPQAASDAGKQQSANVPK